MIGNDDCGQMSAWYILSTLGFYPVNPANGEFVLGSPQVEKASINFSNGNKFKIVANNFSDYNIYNDVRKLNNKIITKPFINYQEIMKGGTLIFEMTNK
jgi:putative alpha-1,2-mannosidase